MTKISLDDLKQALVDAEVEPQKQEKIIEHLNQVVEEQKVEKELNSAPKQKNEFGIIIFDEVGDLAGKELYGHIYSVKQGADHGTILGKISDAVRESNDSAKKKNALIKTIGEAFEHLKRKFSKTHDFQPKTKNIVRIIISNNKLI